MKTINLSRFAAGAALLLWAGLSQAQYLWIDEKGLKQFSDRPPPPNTPLNKILKSPTKIGPVMEPVPDTPTAAPAPGAPSAPAPKGPPTLAERDADYRKRAAEQADKAQKAQEDEKQKAAIAANCETARRQKQSLDSGVRLGIVDSKGQQDVMDDQQRARETQLVNKVLAECKGS